MALIREVYQEIKKAAKGFLKEQFITNDPSKFWIKRTGADVLSLRELVDWVENRKNPKFTDEAKDEFLQVADYFLAARTKTVAQHDQITTAVDTLGATVVTREQSPPEP